MEKKLQDISLTNAGPLKPVHPRVENYIRELLVCRDEPVLVEMEQEAASRKFPIVGRNVGAFLEVMALACSARRIFEFGSGFGYSAYWFSRALPEDGHIVCTDADAGNIAKARHYLGRLGLRQRTEFHAAMAQEVFAEQDGLFDIIYNDVDKNQYPEVWKLARSKLRPGGLYIADNCLWAGRVTFAHVEEDVVPGFTGAVKEHNRLIAEDEDFHFFVNPIRDGVLAAVRICRR